ncbi:histidine kinase [Actinoplanes sp. NPDC051346]|uniref:sensor histidine kinase n=1 Tax=Actinoplanes sp. NPDC051346 TaxID=3155048 RepID=UPI003429188C
MKRISVWLVPAALALLQLAAWPGYPLLIGESVSATEAATALAVTAVAAAALLWRRTAPVAALAVIVLALALGEWGLPTDATTAIGAADFVALYSVAVLRTQRTAVLAALAVMVWQCVSVAVYEGVDPDYAAAFAMIVVFYMTVLALGRSRHRWHADRARAAAELAEAEARRLRAADTERHRLARELHDVTAHHLTSIVVIASAAQRIGGSRPELMAEARDFAARTGRDTLNALHRLVALLQRPDARPDAAGPGLEELAEGFRRLGQRVTVAGAETLPPAVAEAAYGIVREALTNTLRYAPGSAVTVRLDEGSCGVELTVTDDGPAAADRPPAGSLGSGRGITGMRERAEALGGALDAGPRDGGGWRVRAVLPKAGSAAAGRRRPGSDRVIDVAVLLLALLVPAIALLVAVTEPDPASPGTGWVPPAALILIAHAVPLVWRRERPWIVLAVVVVSTWAWPAMVAAGVLPEYFGWFAVAGMGVEILAVHAVARYGRDHVLTWLAMVAVLFGTLPAYTLMLVLDPAEELAGESPAFLLVFVTGVCGIPLAVPLLAAWLIGFLVRHRRDQDRARQHHAVAAATAWALHDAGAERARVAAGLREAVLRDTALVADAADRGDLDEVLTSARAALDGMRGLLNDLREAPSGESAGTDRTPQPTLAALPALAERWRANGRTVTIETTGEGRTLSPDVDLSAYRVVELLLAGDTATVTVRVDLSDDPLRITVTPMPADPGGEVAAGLRARLAAVGGSLGTTADGAPEIRLPATVPTATAAERQEAQDQNVDANEEEVTSSQPG